MECDIICNLRFRGVGELEKRMSVAVKSIHLTKTCERTIPRDSRSHRYCLLQWCSRFEVAAGTSISTAYLSSASSGRLAPSTSIIYTLSYFLLSHVQAMTALKKSNKKCVPEISYHYTVARFVFLCFICNSLFLILPRGIILNYHMRVCERVQRCQDRGAE